MLIHTQIKNSGRFIIKCNCAAFVTTFSLFLATQKKLFTPGPLEVSHETKCAMLKDLGHRDAEFGNAVKFIREKLLDIACVTDDKYTVVPMQGSGTFAVEAVLGTTIPRETGKVFVIANGAYGKRIVRMVEMMGFQSVSL